MKINREWGMPNKNTFTIKPISKLINKYINQKTKIIIDPFANSSKIANITNDLDKTYNTDYNMDAIDFLKMFNNNSVDVVLFDPPYTPRQVKECYNELNRTVTMQDTQASFWYKLKKEISRITKIGGICISCGYNSGGIGKKYGFDIIEILLVAHGGQHNDTIVVVDKKIKDV